MCCWCPESFESGRKLPLFSFIPALGVLKFRSLCTDRLATGIPPVVPDRILLQTAGLFPATLKAELKLPCQTPPTANPSHQVVTPIRRQLRVISWGLIWAPQTVRCAGQTPKWQTVRFRHFPLRRLSVRVRLSGWKRCHHFTWSVVDCGSSLVPADCPGNHPASYGRPEYLLVIRADWLRDA